MKPTLKVGVAASLQNRVRKSDLEAVVESVGAPAPPKSKMVLAGNVKVLEPVAS